MAVATVQSVNISNKLVGIEARNADDNKTQQQLEFRPYLIINLKTKGDLKVGSDGLLYFNYKNQDYLTLAFNFTNEGKIPAVKIQPKYDSYWINSKGDIDVIQEDVPIEPAENIGHIFSNEASRINHTYGPSIYIYKVKNNQEAKGIKVILRTTYQGNAKVYSSVYSSKLILIFEKQKNEVGEIFVLKKAIEEYGQ